MKVNNKSITVQGFGTPVPAALESEQAGSQPSRANDRNVPVVGNLATGADNTASQQNESGHQSETTSVNVNALPFRRSTKITRSPKQGTQEHTNKRPASSPPSLNATNEPRGEGGKQPQKRPCNNTRNENQASALKSSFHKLGEEIGNLIGMLEDGKRRSIHQPMRDTIESIKNLYELSAIESHDETAKQVIRKNNASQTSPCHKLAVKPAEKRGPNIEVQKQNPKTPEPGTSTEAAKTETNSHQNQPVEGQETESGWTRVVRRQKRKRKKPPRKNKRLRPEAIMITTTGDISYADMLKKIKSEPELKEIGESVSKIRKTAKGDLLLTLQGNPNGRATNYKEKLEEFLQDSASIKTLCEEKIIECRDLDEVTTKTELCYALTTQFPQIGVLTEGNVKRLHTTREGTQTAYVSLPARDANMILEKTHVRVGWVSCRLRSNTAPTRCYRCLNFGHVARQCRSEADRTGDCLKCGGKGHKAKECKAPPKCILCGPESGNQHASGSYKCQAYKNAVKALINKHV